MVGGKPHIKTDLAAVRQKPRMVADLRVPFSLAGS